jgi:tight adherence protein C
VLTSQALAAATGLLLGLVAHPGHFPVYLWSPVLGGVGYLIPDALISGKADRRQKELAKTFPEALDLLAITVEAGLGLEAAFQVVTEDLTGPLAEELTRMLREIELGVSRREALGGLRERVDVAEVSAFVVALIQADRMGIAIAEVLRVQASQARLARRQHAREMAAKPPVKILFPVIFAILPALFVITLGPAGLAIVSAFHQK